MRFSLCFGVSLLVMLLTLMPSTAAAETFRVKVIDVAGAPVDNVEIRWVRSHDPRITPPQSFTMYSPDGTAVVPNVLPGVHALRVRAKGYLSVAMSGIVVEDRLPSRTVVRDIIVLLNRSTGPE